MLESDSLELDCAQNLDSGSSSWNLFRLSGFLCLCFRLRFSSFGWRFAAALAIFIVILNLLTSTFVFWSFDSALQFVHYYCAY